MGLLVGMFLKYVVELGEGGVPVLGAVHGALFVIYAVTTLAVARPLGWRFGTVLAALLAAVPPLFTWLFERWALRRGKLDGPERLRYGGTALFVRRDDGDAVASA